MEPREQYPFKKNRHGTELGGRFTLSPISGVAPLKVEADVDEDGVKGAAVGEYGPGSSGMAEGELEVCMVCIGCGEITVLNN